MSLILKRNFCFNVTGRFESTCMYFAFRSCARHNFYVDYMKVLWETLTPSSVRTLSHVCRFFRIQSAAVTVTPLGTGKRVTVSDCLSNCSSFTVACMANWGLHKPGTMYPEPSVLSPPTFQYQFENLQNAEGYSCSRNCSS